MMGPDTRINYGVKREGIQMAVMSHGQASREKYHLAFDNELERLESMVTSLEQFLNEVRDNNLGPDGPNLKAPRMTPSLMSFIQSGQKRVEDLRLRIDNTITALRESLL